MTAIYRAEWFANDDDWTNLENLRTRDFGDNKSAAQAFARRKSGEPRQAGPSVHIVKTVDGVDVGQWVYAAGFTYGFEQ